MQLNKYLKWTAIGALCASLITPLIVSDGVFFPYIVGKALFFRVVTEIAFAAWLLLSLRDASVRPRLSPLLWSFAVFIFVVGLADVFGVDVWKSFWSNFERMEGYLTIIHLGIYFLVASSVLSTEKLWKNFFQVSIWTSAVVSFYGLLQLWGAVGEKISRLDSTLGNATYLAVYLMFNIFFALLLIAKEKKILNISILGVISFINLVVLYNTGTRSAALGLIGGLFIAGLLIAIFDKKSEKRLRVIAGSLAGAAVLVVLGFILIKDSDFVTKSPILSRFASVSVSSIQGQARYYIWPMAIEGFKEKPLLGWGQENFNYVFNEHYDPKLYGQEQWFDRTHNAPIDWLVTTGALGFLSYLSLFFVALYLLWKRSPNTSFVEKSILTGLGAAYFFNNLFVFDNTTSYLGFVMVLAFIHFRSTRLSVPVAEDAEDFDGSDTRVAGGLVLLALLFVLYFFNWRAYATASSLLDALRSSTASSVQADATVKAFEKALSYNTIGRPEIVERLVEAASVINGSAATIETRQKYYQIAKTALDEQIARVPDDARYQLFAGTFYSTYGLNSEAEIHFKKASLLSPGKQTMYFSLGSLYVNEGKFNDALEAFKKAYELDTKNADAIKFYAAAFIYAGKEKEAQDFLKSATGSADMTGDVFLQTYANMSNWTKVISILKIRLVSNPADMNILQNLAAAYFQAGNKAQSIATFREMIRITPSFKEAGEDYIRQVQASK